LKNSIYIHLSFGGVGSKEGYTTVLARTGPGLELFQDAADRGYEPLERQGLKECPGKSQESTDVHHKEKN